MFGQQQIRTVEIKSGLLLSSTAIALILCLVGMYALCHNWVLNRRREIGLRLALGAQTRHVTWIVTRPMLMAVAGGSLLAALGSVTVSTVFSGMIFGMTRAIPEGELFGVQPDDPRLVPILAVVLVMMALLAAFGPIRRALRVDPTESMRHE